MVAHYLKAGRICWSPMGLLAVIFAYLSAVAAIVIFFLMSADALLYHPHHQAPNPHSEIVVAAKIDPLDMKKAPRPPRRAAEVRAIPQRSTATEYRRKSDLSNTRFDEQRKRALRRSAHARNWALRREPGEGRHALGYAEEPAAPFGNDPFR